MERVPRLAALDWMRGLYPPGSALPAGHFFTRWITHLCAPTFVFLAGASLVLSLQRGGSRRDMVLRGLLIIVLEVTLISRSWWPIMGPMIALQVMYAIGLSMVLMALLSRLPSVVLLVAALAWFAESDWITMVSWNGTFINNELMAVILAGLVRWQESRPGPVRDGTPLLVFGRPPWFSTWRTSHCSSSCSGSCRPPARPVTEAWRPPGSQPPWSSRCCTCLAEPGGPTSVPTLLAWLAFSEMKRPARASRNPHMADGMLRP
jgi:hypothetical protein